MIGLQNLVIETPTEEVPDDNPPIIAPDLIGLVYLNNWSNKGDPAYQLWQARIEWIEEQLNELRAFPQNSDGFDSAFAAIASKLELSETPDLVQLYEDRETGIDISQALDELNLSNGAFLYLVRVQNLLVQRDVLLFMGNRLISK